MRKETKETSISPAVKRAVWERDKHRCIFCGNVYAAPVAHVIRRSQGGKGIERNIVTACDRCHREFDEGKDRSSMYVHAVAHLKWFYPDWSREDMIYHKGGKP